MEPTTCYACGVSFTIHFEDTDADFKFCPHCGQGAVEDIELIENYDDVDNSILYGDDEDELS